MLKFWDSGPPEIKINKTKIGIRIIAGQGVLELDLRKIDNLPSAHRVDAIDMVSAITTSIITGKFDYGTDESHPNEFTLNKITKKIYSNNCLGERGILGLDIFQYSDERGYCLKFSYEAIGTLAAERAQNPPSLRLEF